MIRHFETWSILESLDDTKYHLYMIYKDSPSKPLYIGSGIADRVRVSMSNFESKHGESRLKILKLFNTKDEALEAEINMIKKYDLKSEGGTLLMSRIGNTPSEELKQKHSEALIGTKKSAQHKKKISDAIKQKYDDPEYKRKQAESMKGNNNASKP